MTRAALPLFVALPFAAAAATYYVAPTGSDTAPGTLAAPWRTIAKSAATAVAGDTVFLRAGSYHEALVPANSGTASAPITFSSYNNEPVILVGFDAITPGSGGAGQWTQHSANIWKIQLAAAHGFGAGSTGRNQVALGGTLLREARWPNSSVYNDVARMTMTLSDAGSVDTTSRDAQGLYACTYTDAALNGFAANAWVGATMRLAVGKQWNPASGTVTASTSSTITFRYKFLGGGNDNPQRDDPYFLFGRLVALDSDGEFFLDDSGRDGPAFTLYVYSSAGSPAGRGLEVRTRELGVDLSGRSYINIVGLGFVAARITMNAATANCVLDRLFVEQCAQNLGLLATGNGDGVTLAGTNNTLKNSTVNYATQHGVAFASSASGCVVDNCVIDHCGFTGVTTGDSRAPVVKNNTIHDTGSFGIAFNAKAGRFLRNHVYNAGTYCVDIGLINAFAIGDAEGTEIAYNWAHDNLAPYDLSPAHGWNGGCGIRADCGFAPFASLNLLVHHNVVWNTTHPGSIVFWGVTDAQWAATTRTYAQGSSSIDTREFAYHNTLQKNLEFGAGRTGGVPISGSGGRIKNNLLAGTFAPNGVSTTNVEADTNLFATAVSGFASNTISALPFVSPLESGFAIPAAAIDAGLVLAPYTDGYVGARPDLGAYESGGAFWIPGATLLSQDMGALTAGYDSATGKVTLAGLPEGRTIPDTARLRIGTATSTAVRATHDLATHTFRAVFTIDVSGQGGAQAVSLALDGTTFLPLAATITLPGAQTGGGTGPAAASARTFRVEPVAGFAITGNVPNATYVAAENKVYLIYSVAGGIVQATSTDGVTFSDVGVLHAGLTTLLAPVGKNGVDLLLRTTVGGVKRYFAGGLARNDPTRHLYRADADASGKLTLTSTPVYIPAADEGAHAGVPDIIVTRDGRWRMFYVPVPAARNNTRTAVSSDEGASWTYESNNPFGDFAASQGAATTNVDPCPFRLADGTYFAVTMRAGKLYFWNSDDGLTFTEIAGSELTAAAFSATAPGASALFDPTIVQLFDGTIYLYATAGVVSGTYTERLVAARLVPSSGGTATATARIGNLSILTALGAAGESFTVGTVIGGAGTSGVKPLLIRAAGPSLAAFGVATPLADPRLDVLSGQSVVANNDNWGGGGSLAALFAQVGAFAYASTGSRDAAVAFSPTVVAPASYTIQITGVGGATGAVLAELYDATPAASFAASTPRLINVSVLKQISAGGSLTAGFVIAGSGSRQVLVRAVGPALSAAPFSVSGAMADPQIALFNGPAQITANDNWGGGAGLASAFSAVGAFALPAGSRDAALLSGLGPGNYTAQVTGAAGAGGWVLVEVYEIP
ncbi:MAG: right-handed parallel beta-helix repeat-containing protein [Verrucomicrobia bacterium]|nr:right-handed parallel beta-helix repeat-containing protein [Verrucomicrobiota bacterium]